MTDSFFSNVGRSPKCRQMSTHKRAEVHDDASECELENPDAAAFSFAMGVHSILNYEMDLMQVGEKPETDMMGDYIDEFCRIYGG